VRLILAFLLALLATPALAGPCETLQASIAVGGVVVVGPEHAGCNASVRTPGALVGGPGAALRSVTVAGVDGFRLEGVAVTLTPNATTAANAPAVRITKSANVRIVGNVLVTSVKQGMRLEHLVDFEVSGNVLLQATGRPGNDTPSINLVKPYAGWKGAASERVTFTGNVAADGFGAFAGQPGNTVLPSGPHPALLLDLARAGRVR
jgi:hypothetical protein